MLLIIELLFLIAGLWAIISGKLPVGLFTFLFGKGEYELPSTQARLFGVFLSSPLPASFLVSFLLIALLGTKGNGYAIIFEVIYILVVIITSIIIARKARRPVTIQIETSLPVDPFLDQKTIGYGLRLLIIFGIVVLVCITSISFFSLIMVIVSSITVGTRLTGNFWSDVFPFVLMVTGIGFGSFGIYKLVQILRK